MELIAHRLNKIKELTKLPKKYGAEIDLRSSGSKIILHHDSFKKGEKFENYLSNYNHGTLILNIKESGIEKEAIKIVKKFNIKNFFLIDVELPFIFQNNKSVNKDISIRYSEYESIETVKKFVNNVGWIWIDTHKKLPLNKNISNTLKKFKSCLVCPERWGRPKDIRPYFQKMQKINFIPNSVMTAKKYFKTWESLSR
ncbi:hypothetical protein IDH12_04595 [Pelagibacterales bacterium SAG-MED29]|nr:hypothetical protein [Pelagibacterales bacterium SAG-MED29]